MRQPSGQTNALEKQYDSAQVEYGIGPDLKKMQAMGSTPSGPKRILPAPETPSPLRLPLESLAALWVASICRLRWFPVWARGRRK
jgi:hypothetical protein